jgi:acetyl esterase
MPIDDKTRAVIAAMEAVFPPLDLTRNGTETRALIKQAGEAVLPSTPAAVGAVDNLTIPGPRGDIPIRLYYPIVTDPGLSPAVAFFHGGGWVVCDLESHDDMCRALTNASGCVVMAVDYRLAPEHPFPQPPEDCYAALQWLGANAESVGVDPARLAVMGDSAGGNLAAVTAQMARDLGGPVLRYQVLVYPVTNFSDDTPSHRGTGDGYFLRSAEVMYYWREYLVDEADGALPYASPLRAQSLAGLPPALIVTAEFDPLRDEGEAYGRRLQEAGVPATVHRYDGMFHSFVSFLGVLDAADEALGEIADALRAALTDRESVHSGG